MSRDLITLLYNEIVIKNRCSIGTAIPDDIMMLVSKIRILSRCSIKTQGVTMSDLEILIDCLNSLHEYFTELEYILTISIYNILLQNRALLIQLTGQEEIEYFYTLFEQTADSCLWFVKQKQPDFVPPKNMFQVESFSTRARGSCKIFNTIKERELVFPKLKLVFLLVSQKVPLQIIEMFITRYFPTWNFLLSLLLHDTFSDILAHSFHDCNTLKSVIPLFTELFNFWYAFSCNYETEMINLARKQGWDDVNVARWGAYYLILNELVQIAIGLYQAKKYFTLNRIKVKTTLSVMNVLMMASWDVSKKWIMDNGISKFYLPHVLVFKLIDDNLKSLDHDHLYSESEKSFTFINMEILPLLCIQNHLLDISDRYDRECQHENKNFTRALLNYAYSGKADRKKGTPDTLGIPEHFIDQIPDLRPGLEKVLQEPLLTKLNKEILEILKKLGLEIPTFSKTQHSVKLDVHNEQWNLVALNVASGKGLSFDFSREHELLKEEEADLILTQLEKLNVCSN